jgi:hypothetical protein
MKKGSGTNSLKFVWRVTTEGKDLESSFRQREVKGETDARSVAELEPIEIVRNIAQG